MFESIKGKARAQDGCVFSYSVYPQPGKTRVVFIHSLAQLGAQDMWKDVVTELVGDVEM